MGVCIYANGAPISMDMGYGTFNVMRDIIAQYVSETPSAGTVKFLEACDCEGTLTHRECIELHDDIRTLETDREFGYVWAKHRTINDFRRLLLWCYSHRCYLRWN